MLANYRDLQRHMIPDKILANLLSKPTYYQFSHVIHEWDFE